MVAGTVACCVSGYVLGRDDYMPDAAGFAISDLVTYAVSDEATMCEAVVGMCLFISWPRDRDVCSAATGLP